MTWFDNIPDEYQEHLPGPPPGLGETLKGVGGRGLEEGLEPFLEVGTNVKESLKRVYAVAAQPLGGEAVKPKPFSEAPFEFMASLAGYVAALPIRGLQGLLESNKTLQQQGAQMLLGGPRGEGGEWTEKQVGMSMLATELTLGVMAGSKPGAGTGPANIGLGSSGKGAKRVVGALERLSEEYRSRAKPLRQLVELSAKPGARKNLSRKVVEFIHGQKLGELTQMKRNYPTVTKGLRQIPQEALDLVGDIGLAPKAERGIAGRFRPKKSRAEYQITSKVAIPKETIPHEIFHATQIAKLKAKGIKKIRPEVLEAQTHEFEPLFMREVAKLPKGAKMDMGTWNRLYDEAFDNMIKKHGTDFSKYKMSDIIGKGHLARKGELQSVAKPSKTTGAKLAEFTRKGEKAMPKLSQEDKALRDITKASMGRFLREQGLAK